MSFSLSESVEPIRIACDRALRWMQARFAWSALDGTGPPRRSHRSPRCPSNPGPATMTLTPTSTRPRPLVLVRPGAFAQQLVHRPCRPVEHLLGLLGAGDRSAKAALQAPSG